MITILGYVAAIFTTISFIPQVIQVVKTRQVENISLWMYLMFIVGVLLWLVYGIIQNVLPIIVSNLIIFPLSFIILVYKIKSLNKHDTTK